jgi:hypothetical protein
VPDRSLLFSGDLLFRGGAPFLLMGSVAGAIGVLERIVGNLHRALAELDGAPQGAPIDVAAALTDMVAYNGGQPLTCYA